jgi:putative NADH-flavin reductase
VKIAVVGATGRTGRQVVEQALDRDHHVVGVPGGIGSSRAPTTVYSQGIANVVGAMGAASVTRLAVISAAPVGPRPEQPFLEGRLVMPILDRFFGATYADMRRMEAVLGGSRVDWVSLRPPRLVDKPATGAYRIAADVPLPRARSLRYPDLATALLDVLEREDLQRHAAFVAN